MSRPRARLPLHRRRVVVIAACLEEGESWEREEKIKEIEIKKNFKDPKIPQEILEKIVPWKRHCWTLFKMDDLLQCSVTATCPHTRWIEALVNFDYDESDNRELYNFNQHHQIDDPAIESILLFLKGMTENGWSLYFDHTVEYFQTGYVVLIWKSFKEHIQNIEADIFNLVLR